MRFTNYSTGFGVKFSSNLVNTVNLFMNEKNWDFCIWLNNTFSLKAAQPIHDFNTWDWRCFWLAYYIIVQLCRQCPVAALMHEKSRVRHCASSFTCALQSSFHRLPYSPFEFFMLSFIYFSSVVTFHFSSIGQYKCGAILKKLFFSVVFCNTYLHNRQYKLFYLWYWIVFKSCNKLNYQLLERCPLLNIDLQLVIEYYASLNWFFQIRSWHKAI